MSTSYYILSQIADPHWGSLHSFRSCAVISLLPCLENCQSEASEYSVAPCAVCVCVVCVYVCASGATHTILNSSMDKRLYPSPSVLTHTHTQNTQRSSRGICEQQSMLKATLSEPLEMNAALSVCLSLCIQPCVHTLQTVRKNGWRAAAEIWFIDTDSRWFLLFFLDKKYLHT